MDFIEAFFAAFISLLIGQPLWVYSTTLPVLLIFGWWAAKEFWGGVLVAGLTFLTGAFSLAFLWAIVRPGTAVQGG